MSAYSPEDWSDFLVASSGASAALAGLVFIGISINLTRILDGPGLPGRAGQTIVVPTPWPSAWPCSGRSTRTWGSASRSS